MNATIMTYKCKITQQLYINLCRNYFTLDLWPALTLVRLTNIINHYMTSDNVFSDWLKSLVKFFDKTLYHIFRLKYRCFVYALSMIVPNLYRTPRPISHTLYRMGVFFKVCVILIVFPKYISFLMKLIMYCSVLCGQYSILC